MDTGGEMAKRLTKERERDIRETLSGMEMMPRSAQADCSVHTYRWQVGDLLAEIGALRAELSAARTKLLRCDMAFQRLYSACVDDEHGTTDNAFVLDVINSIETEVFGGPMASGTPKLEDVQP